MIDNLYRSLEDRERLVSQHNCNGKLYDHDIFIEPALARTLHLRDIQSKPKDTETRLSKVEFVCHRYDLLQRRIKFVYTDGNLHNFKGTLTTAVEFPSIQSQTASIRHDHARKPLLSIYH